MESRPPTNDQGPTPVFETPAIDQQPTAHPEPTANAVPTSTQLVELATPYAQEPASGICSAAEGDLVSVEIFPDIPSPRCVQVSAGQRLQVTNQTDQEITLELGPYVIQLAAGEVTVLDASLGTFLAPGAHVLGAAPFSGPELWLKE